MRALSFFDKHKMRYLIYQVNEAGDKPNAIYLAAPRVVLMIIEILIAR